MRQWNVLTGWRCHIVFGHQLRRWHVRANHCHARIIRLHQLCAGYVIPGRASYGLYGSNLFTRAVCVYNIGCDHSYWRVHGLCGRNLIDRRKYNSVPTSNLPLGSGCHYYSSYYSDRRLYRLYSWYILWGRIWNCLRANAVSSRTVCYPHCCNKRYSRLYQLLSRYLIPGRCIDCLSWDELSKW